MSFLTLDSMLRTLLFGGSFFFALTVVAFIVFNSRRRWVTAVPWMGLGLMALALTVPGLGFSVLGLGARYQSWVTPLACLNLSGAPLATVTVLLYATTGRRETGQTEGETPTPRAYHTKPYFQPVCRNPHCRAHLAPDERICPVCGWDQTRPISPGEMPIPVSSEAAHAHPGLVEDGEVLAFLVVRNGPQSGASYRLSRETDIGSGADNQIALDDPFVSEVHATVRRKRSAYVMYDMSENGSYLVKPSGKERLDVPVRLRHGDIIEVGDTELVFMQVESKPESAREGTHVRQS